MFLREGFDGTCLVVAGCCWLWSETDYRSSQNLLLYIRAHCCTLRIIFFNRCGGCQQYWFSFFFQFFVASSLLLLNAYQRNITWEFIHTHELLVPSWQINPGFLQKKQSTWFMTAPNCSCGLGSSLNPLFYTGSSAKMKSLSFAKGCISHGDFFP